VVPFAYLDPMRQVVAVEGGRRVPLTTPTGVLWASWGQHSPEDVHSWPSWSPDGRRLAAFRIGRGGGPTRTVICDAQGVSSTEGATLGVRVPIYLQWSKDSAMLAVLSQQDDVLVLEKVDADSPDRSVSVLSGTPLFFSWLGDGRIAAFVGERTGPVLVVVAPDGTRIQLPGIPGNFCAPVPVGDELIYVAHHRGRVTILTGRSRGTGTRELEIVDGLVALVGSPDGTLVARAVAADGDGSPYRDLRLLDPRSGATRGLSDADCMAFFWAGDALVVARRHPHRQSIAWLKLTTDGREEQIAELYPSRDLRFWLRFFDQYSGSHPIVDREATTLLLSGGLVGKSDPQGSPRVWAVPLDGGPAEEIGEGWFATFSATSSSTPV
jgi:hypothetical protein